MRRPEEEKRLLFRMDGRIDWNIWFYEVSCHTSSKSAMLPARRSSS